MSYVEKYTVSKRGKEEGPYAAAEIIDLLRMKELSTIHKVKVGADWMVVPDFIDLFEKGELPEQNLEKSFEDAEEAAKEEEEAAESEEATEEPEPEPEPEPIEVPEPGPAVEIHVNRSGTQFGPYLFKELKDYLKAGNLRFSDMVWFEGLPEWVQLSSIPGVADGIDSLGSAAPPPQASSRSGRPCGTTAHAASSPPKPSPSVQSDEEDDEKDEEDFDVALDEDDAEASTNLAPHGARVMAALVDGLIVVAVMGILIGVAGLVTEFNTKLLLGGGVGYLVLGWLYYGLTESSKAGGGLGKRMSKLRVIKADGLAPGFAAVSMRSLLKILFSFTIILPFVALLTPRRQGLHDLACGTLVESYASDE